MAHMDGATHLAHCRGRLRLRRRPHACRKRPRSQARRDGHYRRHPLPVVGLISMDLTCIDITDLGDGWSARGDVATFIGKDIPVDEVAASAGTIGYEILTRLGPRCHLVYRGG